MACALAPYGLGARLVDAFDTMTHTAFQSFLIGWRDDLRVILRSDPQGYIGRKYKVGACHITTNFPDQAILRAYACPLTSWSKPAGRHTILSMRRGESQPPNLGGLAEFCFRLFEWSPEVVHEKFARIIWPGVCLKMLCQVSSPFTRVVVVDNSNGSLRYLLALFVAFSS